MAIPSAAVGRSQTRLRFVHRVARQLEAFSVAAAPEQLAIEEGLRAAVVVASFVGLAVWFDRPLLSWAAFGAFWTCLADPGGTDRRRLACMGGFALAGSLTAWASATAGEAGVVPGGVAVLVLAFLTGLSGMYGQAAAQVGTLAAVVSVVAVAFPQPPAGALAQSLTFLLGTIGALVVCIGIWRIHPHETARRALGATYLMLGQFLGDCLALDQRDAPAAAWKNLDAAHRRAVRGAIERTRTAILGLEDGTGRYRAELDTADRVFAAIVAAGHERCSRGRRWATDERGLLHRLLLLLAETRHQSARRAPLPDVLAAETAGLCRAAGSVGTAIGRIVLAASRALSQQAQGWAEGPAEIAAPAHGPRDVQTLIRPVPAAVLRHAARLAVAVGFAYALAASLRLPFSYWTTMATVVVVQPVGGAAWPRSLERMLGSIAGGLLAALLILLAPAPLVLLPAIFPIATATIALRRVNYTLFVVAVTCLFVLVAELLLPATGIAAARAINNVIGSEVGAAAALVLWPEREADNLGAALADAVCANVILAARAITAEKSADFDAARRAAGLASTKAETTCRRLALAGRSRRLHLREASALLAALRSLAGAALAQALADSRPDPARAAILAERACIWADALREAAMTARPLMGEDEPDEIGTALGDVAKAEAAFLEAHWPHGHADGRAPLDIQTAPNSVSRR